MITNKILYRAKNHHGTLYRCWNVCISCTQFQKPVFCRLVLHRNISKTVYFYHFRHISETLTCLYRFYFVFKTSFISRCAKRPMHTIYKVHTVHSYDIHLCSFTFSVIYKTHSFNSIILLHAHFIEVIQIENLLDL